MPAHTNNTSTPHLAERPNRQKKNILVLYQGTSLPLRNTTETHLYCWKRYSQHQTIYFNTRFPLPEWLLRFLRVDAIVGDTLFADHWENEFLENFPKRYPYLTRLGCLKLILPQDEFYNMKVLNTFIGAFGITHLLTVSLPHDWPTLYPDVDPTRVHIETKLTGYLDDGVVSRVNALAKEMTNKATEPSRPIDIGYKVWKSEYWLGEHAMHKVWLAERVDPLARERQLTSDLETFSQYALYGDDWFRYLLSCRATIGVESGASLLDWEGNIRKVVTAYVQANPQASFQTVRDACFPGLDYNIRLFCVSPRHLECALTRTCQILLEGEYNGMLTPWVHYIPVQRDYSNLEAAIDFFLNQPEAVATIVENAYQDLVATERYHYKTFVRHVETSILEATRLDPASPPKDHWQSPAWFQRILIQYFEYREHYTNWLWAFYQQYRNTTHKPLRLWRKLVYQLAKAPLGIL
ncbi:MAG: hypothetical protein SFZ03_05210 [Candidatus Melainabacteria bacterium]|nr:hypothetical protein [Candidatus Melainabacteria bacterium]